MTTETKNIISMLVHNLDESSRKAGYYNNKVNSKQSKDNIANYETFRSYSLKIMAAVRGILNGTVNDDEAMQLLYSMPDDI